MNDVILIDDFLDDPDSMRDLAIRYRGIWTKRGNHPGLRSIQLSDISMEHVYILHDAIQEKLDFYYGVQDSMFQYCVTADGNSWVHQDRTNEAILIVYLSPDPPAESGTIFYKSEDGDDIDFIVENKYNRAMLYNGYRFHKSNNYFGDCLKNGRLFLINFMKF